MGGFELLDKYSFEVGFRDGGGLRVRHVEDKLIECLALVLGLEHKKSQR